MDDDQEENDQMLDYQTGIQDNRSEQMEERSNRTASVEFGSNLMDISTDSSLDQRQRELEAEKENQR